MYHADSRPLATDHVVLYAVRRGEEVHPTLEQAGCEFVRHGKRKVVCKQLGVKND
jgi:hypothetical protein